MKVHPEQGSAAHSYRTLSEQLHTVTQQEYSIMDDLISDQNLSNRFCRAQPLKSKLT